MKTETYKINKVEDAKSSSGKSYTKVFTDKGVFTCFDSDISDGIREYIGGMVGLVLKESKTIPNLFSVVGIDDSEMPKIAPSIMQVPKGTVDSLLEQIKNKEPHIDTKTTTMYTSYAKDIFIALLNNRNKNSLTDDESSMLMDYSITLVKQAREAFS